MTRKPLLLAAAILLLTAGSAMALSISDVVGDATNITIYDGESGATSGWYGPQEDQEVEVGMQTGQIWDMEAMFWDGSTLYMVAGFDFMDGQSGYAVGDVFLTVGGTHYVLDFDRTVDDYSNLSDALTFDLYADNGDGLETLSVKYSQNDIPSNPYAHDTGDNDDTLLQSDVKFSFHEGVTDGEGIEGGTHYILALTLKDLSGLDLTDGFQAHLTMRCGNDDMEGAAAPVPEPSTVFLLGIGLVGLAGFGRRRMVPVEA